MPIGISYWTCTQTLTSRDIAMGKTPKVWPFNSPLDALNHLAAILDAPGGYDELVSIQTFFHEKLDTNADVRALPRPTRQSTPYFLRYVKEDYLTFQEACHAKVVGTATAEQTHLVSGLGDEIVTHGVTLRAGQQLFHGEENVSLTASSTHPGFVSTSLNPCVAVTHATKSFINLKKPKRVVYILTLAHDMKALWHHSSVELEYEFLLPCGLTIDITKLHSGKFMDVIEADVSAGP